MSKDVQMDYLPQTQDTIFIIPLNTKMKPRVKINVPRNQIQQNRRLQPFSH